MSFSRLLKVDINPDIIIKHNQVLINVSIYNRLLDITDGGIIILRITIDNKNVNDDKEYYVTVVGPTNYPRESIGHVPDINVLVSQEVIDYFGENTKYRFTYVKKLPILTSLTIKFIENEYCFMDSRDALQQYLENYHIVYKGMLISIPSEIEGIVGIATIEEIKPSNACRVPNGEVELEIVTDEFATAAVAQPTVIPTPISSTPASNLQSTSFNFHNMKRELFPDLVTTTQTTSEPMMSKEELRAARLAFYSNKN